MRATGYPSEIQHQWPEIPSIYSHQKCGRTVMNSLVLTERPSLLLVHRSGSRKYQDSNQRPVADEGRQEDGLLAGLVKEKDPEGVSRDGQ